MNSIAYVRLIPDDTELFTYLDTAVPEHFLGYTYKLGDILLNLLDLNIEDVKNSYTDLSESMAEPALKANDDALADIRLRINKIDETYPALWFHTHLLYDCFGDIFSKDTITINEDLQSFRNAQSLLDSPEFHILSNAISKSSETIALYFSFVAKVLIEDIGYWKAAVRNEMELIFKYNNLDFFKQLFPAQRLYFLDRIEDRIAHSLPFTFVDYVFKTQMILDDQDSAVLSIKPEDRAEQILRGDVGLNEMYVLHSLRDYLQFELIKFVLSDLPLLQCQNCGRIFIPRGRPDVKYCDKVAEGEALPCDAIGALRVYKSKTANDPIFKAFNRAYKRMNSRIKYKTLSQQEFYEWSEKARAMREKCISGEISLEKFNKWLGNKPHLK